MAFQAKLLNEKRGTGQGSRSLVQESDLPEGWRYERHSGRYCVWYDEQGKRYKSSKEVQARLKELGLLSVPHVTLSETETETEETASEYEPSPTKKSRTAELTVNKK